MTRKISFLAAALCLSASCAHAQGECIIEGRVGNDSLRFERQRIEKVYLSRLDEYDRMYVVDSAALSPASDGGVVARTFRFTRSLADGEPALLHFITGFDNGEIQVFVEPGKVSLDIASAAFPSETRAVGTPANDLYNEYRDIADRCAREQVDSMNVIAAVSGKGWIDREGGMDRWMRIGAESLMRCNAERMQLLLAHNNSPLVPLMFEKEICYMYDKAYADDLLNSLSPDLHAHPYFRSFSNMVKSLDLKTGGELPDITLPLADGSRKTLSDYRGRYVLLDFWASWCGPCRKEIPSIVALYDALSPAQRDRLAIISFSLDNKDSAWRGAIRQLGMDKPGWIHCSDLFGWGSPAVKQMGVEAVPKAILIDPDGRALSFTLRGEELVSRIRQLLAEDGAAR